MTVAQTISAVSRLAEQFHCQRDRSMLDLFAASEYLDHREAVTEESLRDQFLQSPELVNSWLLLSENKRCEGPYLLHEHDRWEVGHYPPGNVVHFDDAASACARFVLLQINELDRIQSSST